MNETMTHIASAVKKELDKGGLGAFTVSARTTGGIGGAFYNRDGGAQAEKFDVSLLIQNDGAETDPVAYKRYIATILEEKLTPLAPYIEFKDAIPEPEKDHLLGQAAKYDDFSDKATAAGLTISRAPSEWLKERAKLAAMEEKADSYVEMPQGNALSIQRNEHFITVSFTVPGGLSAEDTERDLNNRKSEILSLLGRMTAKKLTTDKAEQAAIAQQVKGLDMIITTQSFGNYHTVNIAFRSKAVADAMKEPGGLGAVGAEKVQELKLSNPLMRLKNGDGLTLENPSDLQRAAARAIFFEGEKGEKPVALFSKIAGPKDVKRLMEKTRKYIAEQKPELVEEFDKLLNDKTFKHHSYWATKNEDGTPKKEPVRLNKQEEHAYVEGQFRADFSIPGDKLPEVLKQLAALDGPPASKIDDILAKGPAASKQAQLGTEEPALAGAAR